MLSSKGSNRHEGNDIFNSIPECTTRCMLACVVGLFHVADCPCNSCNPCKYSTTNGKKIPDSVILINFNDAGSSSIRKKKYAPFPVSLRLVMFIPHHHTCKVPTAEINKRKQILQNPHPSHKLKRKTNIFSKHRI